MLTFTGAWSKVASRGVLSRVMVTVTVGVELLPLPAGRAGRLSRRRAGPPLPVPMPPPPAQVATLPTVSMRPPTVEVPSGSTIDTASPGLTRYSWVTSRSTVTMGVVLVAVSTVPPTATAATVPDGRADRGRDRGDPDRTGLEHHLAEQDLAGRRQAEGASASAPPPSAVADE